MQWRRSNVTLNSLRRSKWEEDRKTDRQIDRKSETKKSKLVPPQSQKEGRKGEERSVYQNPSWGKVFPVFYSFSCLLILLPFFSLFLCGSGSLLARPDFPYRLKVSLVIAIHIMILLFFFFSSSPSLLTGRQLFPSLSSNEFRLLVLLLLVLHHCCTHARIHLFESYLAPIHPAS